MGKDHNNLIYEYQDNQEKIKKNRNSDPSEYRETAIIGIRKSKPELAEKAEEILLKEHLCFMKSKKLYNMHEKSVQKKKKKNSSKDSLDQIGVMLLLVLIKNKSKIIIFRLNAFLKIIMMIFIEKEIESLQRNLISNPNYMKYSKNEFHQKTERLAVKQNQEKRSDNNYDPPSLF
jgi:hypothetical protein